MALATVETGTVTLSSTTADLIVDGAAVAAAGQISATFSVQWLQGDDDSVATVSATIGSYTVTTEVNFTR